MAITASALPFAISKATTDWPDSMLAEDQKPQIEVLDAITAIQTATIDSNLPEERDIKITWLDNCDLAVATCERDCTFTGQEADSTAQTLQIDECKEVTFSMRLDPWLKGGDVNVFGLADELAVNLNRAMKVSAEAVAQYAITFMNSNLGVNLATTGIDGFTVASTDTTVTADNYEDTKVIGKFARTAARNKFSSPYFIDGGAFYQLLFMAQTSQGNGEGKGDALRMGRYPMYMDLFNPAAVNGSTEITYMVNKGALAFASKGWYSTNPITLGGSMTRFQIRNRFFPSIVHDVDVHEVCTSGVWYSHYRVKMAYQLFLNPTGCTATQTGLLKFTKDA